MHHYYSLFGDQEHNTNMNTKIAENQLHTTENALPTLYHDMYDQ